jgi:hypothetical protein
MTATETLSHPFLNELQENIECILYRRVQWILKMYKEPAGIARWKQQQQLLPMFREKTEDEIVIKIE